jgi:hypothetical protein
MHYVDQMAKVFNGMPSVYFSHDVLIKKGDVIEAFAGKVMHSYIVMANWMCTPSTGHCTETCPQQPYAKLDTTFENDVQNVPTWSFS